MKKTIYSILGSALLLSLASCSDFLEQSSPSELDRDFVFSDPTTASATMQNAYSVWRSDGGFHGNGSFYNFVVSSSDTELQPESYKGQINRWAPSYFYGYDATLSNHGPEIFDPFGNGGFESPWTNAFNIISLCNTVITSYEEGASFEEMVNQGKPSDLSQVYGEAVCLRATCYYELMRCYGDIPLQLRTGEVATHLTCRDSIAETMLADLERVIPIMYRPGESSAVNKTKFTRTYAEGLVGRIALWEGGYQTWRTDLGADYYKDLKGNVIQFEKVSTSDKYKCFYGRRSDWKTIYAIAEKYLGDAIANSGTAKLQTVDPRSGDRYGNPYQYVFQENMMGVNTDVLTYAGESVYEIPDTHADGNSERPYAFGRPSNGGSSAYYPCKSYGQSRFSPIYYYGDFDPNDLRRDVTCAVTGSNGNGSEGMLSFAKGSRLNGGIANNKWDENRMTNPWTVKQRQSGINNPYMRFSDIILMQAEIKAALGKDGEGRQLLEQIRTRAFGSAALAKTDEFIRECGGLLSACIEERKFEFGGEGSRKFDLIRTNKLETAIAKFRSESEAMINDLETKGWHRFANGNVLPAYVWTKLVDAKKLYGYRLTTQCPADKKDDPVLYPSWRGQNDDWAAVASKNGTSTKALTAGNETNLAIKGLFTYIDPNSAEAKALEAEGYKKTDWGVNIVKNAGEYSYLVYNGYVSGQPPIYLLMIGGNIIKNSDGAFTNGYGFRNE